MSYNQIKELFYSNGIDVFGPVSVEEFSSKRYYESTLLWYSGLDGWISIVDSNEFKHLIGTMADPGPEVSILFELTNITPPLTQKYVPASGNNSKKLGILLVILALLILGISYIFKNNFTPDSTDPVLMASTFSDSNEAKEIKKFDSAAAEAEMKTFRIHWNEFISAIPNEYRQKEIGGIEDLKIILKNNSPYNLESVKVKVVYLKPNGDEFQTEILQFDNVSPNNSKELFCPDSKRGVQVNCSIIELYSASMSFCMKETAQKKNGKSGEDPFYCR